MRRAAPDEWLTLHCAAFAAAIAQADGSREALRLLEQIQIFTRSADCTRDDQHRDYFIIAHLNRAAPIGKSNQNIGVGAQ